MGESQLHFLRVFSFGQKSVLCDPETDVVRRDFSVSHKRSFICPNPFESAVDCRSRKSCYCFINMTREWRTISFQTSTFCRPSLSSLPHYFWKRWRAKTQELSKGSWLLSFSKPHLRWEGWTWSFGLLLHIKPDWTDVGPESLWRTFLISLIYLPSLQVVSIAGQSSETKLPASRYIPIHRLTLLGSPWTPRHTKHWIFSSLAV